MNIIPAFQAPSLRWGFFFAKDSMKKFIPIFCILLLVQSFVFSASRKPVKAKHGMVVSADPLATEVGVEILKQGGNAVDAAVAVGFALAVTYPAAGNIGGGGFMNIRFADGKCYAHQAKH